MSPTFHSLSIRNYRVYAAGALVSNIGTWMGRVAQDWLVLTQLTDHSATALGLVTGLQFAPIVLLAPWTGTIADRFPKRTLLLFTQAGLGLNAALTAILVLSGHIRLWHAFVLAFTQGIIAAIDNPARQTFVSEMVPRDHLSNAVGLNSASFNLGRLVGPGVAGVLIAAFGTGEAFVVNAASFGFPIIALSMMRIGELHPAPRATGKGRIREGLRYVRGRPDLVTIMALVFVLGTFGMNFQMTTALMATQVYGMGAGEYGLLGSIMAVGSLVAALWSARRAHPRLRVLVTALVAFTLFTALASVAPTYPIFAVALIPVGLSALTALTTANTLVQLSVEPHVRGRVMALYMAVFMGGTPFGSPLIGKLGEVAGPRWTIAIGPIMVGLSLVVLAVWVLRHDNVRVSYVPTRRPRLNLQVIAADRPAERVTHDTPEAAR